MSRPASKKRTRSKAVDAEMARAVNDRHDGYIARGFMLARSSRVWLRRDGGLTIRLVYRRSKANTDHWASIVEVHRTQGGAP
ncbi:MAG: hypothetical protein JJ926_03905 [Roseitalea sp.]|nr:hypothetical protein [Roseitalea sp.]MBO6951001.1 hypothetical protein [Rhizobiaceae bacterium]MBO6591012.1 hypothetical protein [Roseitalea sp.]MBO6599730.1 hypothetical protein [Roseitalea sp.]MBO6611486.1 hypothetical protein [Roseitalea sp.]